MRRDGVRGLFIALFAEEDMAGDDAPLEKLESVSNLLKSPPVGIDPDVCLFMRLTNWLVVLTYY